MKIKMKTRIARSSLKFESKINVKYKAENQSRNRTEHEKGTVDSTARQN